MGVEVKGCVSIMVMDTKKRKLVPLLTPDDERKLRVVVTRRTAKEVADELKVTLRSAEHTIEKLRKKLNCDTKVDLILRVYSLKLMGEDVSV